MATKKQKEAQADTNLAFALIPFILAAIAFSLYHYAKLKAKYLTGPHTRRVFDMGTNWEAMLRSSVMAFAYAALAWLLYQRAPWTMVLSVPLGLVVLNWVGKVQAQAFLGVVVDYQQGLIYFPPNSESLDISDYLTVLPVVRQFTTLDSVPLADVQRITRQAGKKVFLHGDFGSRRISFTNKLKRDECIHLITADGNSRVKVMSELE